MSGKSPPDSRNNTHINFREDCHHLDRLLPNFSPGKTLLSMELSKTFAIFAKLRQPRTAALVKGARAQGESRVVNGGAEVCLERDERLRKAWQNTDGVEAKYDTLFREPS